MFFITCFYIINIIVWLYMLVKITIFIYSFFGLVMVIIFLIIGEAKLFDIAL